MQSWLKATTVFPSTAPVALLNFSRGSGPECLPVCNYNLTHLCLLIVHKVFLLAHELEGCVKSFSLRPGLH